MASHEELVAELPRLEKLTNAQRQKKAKTRRKKQLQKWREWEQNTAQTDNFTATGSVRIKDKDQKTKFSNNAHLNEAVMRNDCSEGKSRYLPTKLTCSKAAHSLRDCYFGLRGLACTRPYLRCEAEVVMMTTWRMSFAVLVSRDANLYAVYGLARY